MLLLVIHSQTETSKNRKFDEIVSCKSNGTAIINKVNVAPNNINKKNIGNFRYPTTNFFLLKKSSEKYLTFCDCFIIIFN